MVVCSTKHAHTQTIPSRASGRVHVLDIVYCNHCFVLVLLFLDGGVGLVRRSVWCMYRRLMGGVELDRIDGMGWGDGLDRT